MKLAKILKDAHRGAPAINADALLTDLVSAVREHGKAGSLTLKIDVKPIGGDEVNVFVDTTIKAPKAPVRPSLFFIDKDNSLTRDDPNQTEMFPEGNSAPAPGKVHPLPVQATGTQG